MVRASDESLHTDKIHIGTVAQSQRFTSDSARIQPTFLGRKIWHERKQLLTFVCQKSLVASLSAAAETASS